LRKNKAREKATLGVRRQTIDQERAYCWQITESEKNLHVFQSPKRQNEYLRDRPVPKESSNGHSAYMLVGAAMIAASILLSTLLNAVGTRYMAIESPTEESAWLVDRLTGSVYKCQAEHRGKASCEADLATGSIGRPKP
jgi:hypothetical protein